MTNLMTLFINGHWYLYFIILFFADIVLEKLFEILALYVDKIHRSKNLLFITKIIKAFLLGYLYILSFICGSAIFYVSILLFKIKLPLKVNLLDNSFIITFLLSTLIIFFHKTLFNEWKHLLYKTRRLTIDEYNRIKPQLDKIFKAGSLKLFSKKPLSLRVMNKNDSNAFACGRSTIVFTTGLLSKLNDEEISGIIAHELAHLINEDNNDFSFIKSVSFFFILYCSVINITYKIVNYIKGNYEITILFLWPLVVLLNLAKYINNLLIIPIDTLLKAFNRHQEYLADNFAVEIGQKENLINALKKFDDNKYQNLYLSLKNTHPTSEFRIEALTYGYYYE